MSKSSAEAFKNKVSLIYEFNKTSPLFIRKAEAEMENNHIEKAIEILNSGLKLYPDYSAAHLLLGKARMLTGHFDAALKSIKAGCANLHSPRTYEFYLSEIEEAKKQRSLFDSSKRTSFFDPPNVIEQQVKSSAVKIELGVPDETKDEPVEQAPFTNVDDRLEEIAKKISFAKIKEPRSDFNYEDSVGRRLGESSLIVSETLAKIYIAQQEYQEAITVYKKLIQKNPSKQEYYQQKIIEIQSKIE